MRDLPSTSKVGRNDPCPCGSGKKIKKCCESPEKWNAARAEEEQRLKEHWAKLDAEEKVAKEKGLPSPRALTRQRALAVLAAAGLLAAPIR